MKKIVLLLLIITSCLSGLTAQEDQPYIPAFENIPTEQYEPLEPNMQDVQKSTGIDVRGSLELTFGISSYLSNFDNQYESYNGYSFGISSRINIIDSFGIGIHANFIYYPEILFSDKLLREQNIYIANSGELLVGNSDDDFIFGFELLLGPSFMLYDNGNLKIPVTIGYHGFGVTAIAEITTVPKPGSIGFSGNREIGLFHFNFGIGFTANIEYHFSQRFYLVGRIQGCFDFVYLRGIVVETPQSYLVIVGGTDNGYTDTYYKYGFSRIFNITPQIGIGIKF